jgi:hypothetical protein
MAKNRGFTWSPFGIAWADNNWPNEIYLAGPPVAARSCPVVGKKLWWCCGPDRSRNGGEASASVILPKVDGGEVVLHPSGWIDGICMPRGWPLSPDTACRPGGKRSTNDRPSPSCHERIRMRRHVYPVLSLTAGKPKPSMACAATKFSNAVRRQRER